MAYTVRLTHDGLSVGSGHPVIATRSRSTRQNRRPYRPSLLPCEPGAGCGPGWLACTLLLAVLLSGCGSVHPGPDYRHAADLVGERTGYNAVYTPDQEDEVEARVSAMLQDGITPEEAVGIALLNNRAFQARFQDIGVSRAELAQSTLLTNPSLSFSARALDTGGRANLSFSLAQELADLWQIPVRKRVAREKLESTVLGVAAAGIDLVARAQTAYIELRVQQALERLAGENLELLQQTLDMTRRRFDAGETTILDVNLIQSSVFEGAAALSSAQRDLSIARSALAETLGLSVEQGAIAATETLPERAPQWADDMALVRQALDDRLDIRMASADLDAAAEEIRGQKRAVFPSVVVGIDGERPDVASTGPQKSLADQIATLDTLASSPSQALRDRIVDRIDQARQHKQDKAETVDLLLGPSLQMTLPIFDQNHAQKSKSQFLYMQKQKEYEQQILTIAREVLEASANARAAAEQLRIVREQALPLASQNVETARHVYEAGEESILALMMAQQTFQRQREAEITLAGACATTRVTLEHALGGRADEGPVNEPPCPKAVR